MILGTRGIPAQHGGFETFAEDLSLHLVARGHLVTVYCQTDSVRVRTEDIWNGVHRVLIPSANHSLDTVSYDWVSTMHASRQKGVVLTLGYNTGLFGLVYRLRHVPNVMNMDGIEWKREKWSALQKTWLWLNEWTGARLANHLIADHPEIAAHLQRHTSAHKISVIPYGADAITCAPIAPLTRLGLTPKNYYLLVARPEPENSILEIVQSFASERVRTPLVVLGDYSMDRNEYQRQVLDAAGRNVKFVGAIYDREIVQTLRFHAKAYMHGHRVGGTNPSLVESLGAGNAIVAHDNKFNRWVAGKGAIYFQGAEDLEKILYTLQDSPSKLAEMEEASRERHRLEFTKEKALSAYESLLVRMERWSGKY